MTFQYPSDKRIQSISNSYDGRENLKTKDSKDLHILNKIKSSYHFHQKITILNI